jgi:formylglycine-generating enzyme required for sulfatase activity
VDDRPSLADARFDDVPLALLMQIDQLADDFESACRSGGDPSVDSFVRQLDGASGEVRAALASHLEQIREEVQAQDAASEKTIRRGDAGSSTPPADLGPAHPPLAIPLDQPVLIGEYRLIKQLGAGGMGVVYKAVHTRLDRHVAIKFPRYAAGLDRRATARYVREARLIARLAHPHIVQALDAGDSPYGPYLVTEFIDGETLEARVHRDGPLPLPDALALAVQAAAALAHAHDHNIIHRDVKPSNMLLDAGGMLRVVDFGLAKTLVDDQQALVGQRSEQTEHGAFLGTVGYAAPEQLYAGRTVDHRADIYALGCVLHFMLTGKTPHTGTLADRLLAERRPRAAMLLLNRSDLPPGFIKTWRRMVAAEPGRRFDTMAQAHDALEESIHPSSAAGPRVNRLAAFVAIACAAALGLIAWAAATRQNSIPSTAPGSGASIVDDDSNMRPVDPPPPMAIGPFDARQAKAHQAAWARHLKTPVRISNDAGMLLVLIPPGEFTMGLSEAPLNAPPLPASDWRIRQPDEDRNLQLPRHRVAITRPVYFAETEVTNAQFRQFVDAAGYVTDVERGRGWGREDRGWVRRAGYSWRNLGQRLVEDDYPVINVTWNDGVAFCKWLNTIETRGRYRLPTEAEWEYACRAGSDSHYSFGNDSPDLGNHAWFKDNSEGRYRPGGLKQPNAFGLYDMHGNRQEWCLDVFDPDYYKSSPLENPLCEGGGAKRVLRGGVHTDAAAFCTASQRWSQEPNDPGAAGLRVVCELALTLTP